MNGIPRVQQIACVFQKEGDNSFQYIDEFFPFMAVQLDIVLLDGIQRKKGENAGEHLPGNFTGTKNALIDLRADFRKSQLHPMNNGIGCFAVNGILEQLGKRDLQNVGKLFQGIQRNRGKPPLKLGQESDRKAASLAQLLEGHLFFNAQVFDFCANGCIGIQSTAPPFRHTGFFGSALGAVK